MSFAADLNSSTPYDSKIRKTSTKKRKESRVKNDGMKTSRRGSVKRSSWIPRIRHNYVPLRPNSYTIHPFPDQKKTIPFVCGQSISKTHNIGLKIQETLNSIKQEKAKHSSLYKAQFPRVYTHNYHYSSNQHADGFKPLSFKPSSMSKRKPVEMGYIKNLFMEMYQELTNMAQSLGSARRNSKVPENYKSIESLEQAIKKKEFQISITMGLYKEVMCLRKILGIKTEKQAKMKQFTFIDEPSKKKIVYKNIKEYQGGDH